MKRLNYSITGNGAVIFIDGEVYNVPKTHRYYTYIVNILLEEEDTEDVRIDRILSYMDLGYAIESFADGRITIKDGEMFYNGQAIEATALVDRIMTLRDEGHNFKHLVKFLDNLMDNPSEDSRADLYRFLSKNNLPITGDGYFLAYKKVRENYTDIHSGMYDNSIGAIVEMPRAYVDPDRNETCSFGLHAASIDYMDFYGPSDSTKVIIVKINPADVVSVPVDHNDAKLRTCRYEVIAEMEAPSARLKSNFIEDPDEETLFDFDDEDEEDDYNPFWADEDEEEEDEWDGSFSPYGIEDEEEDDIPHDAYDESDLDDVSDRDVVWTSNGAEKKGTIIGDVRFGDSLWDMVEDYVAQVDYAVDASKIGRTKDVSSKDRYLVSVYEINGKKVDPPVLHAPMDYQLKRK